MPLPARSILLTFFCALFGVGTSLAAPFQATGLKVGEKIQNVDPAEDVCGDRHWQYHSIHPETGIREYSCGPASNEHAGGWQQSDYRDDYHQFLRVQGGFLSGTVQRQQEKPTLTFRFHANSIAPDRFINR